MITVQNAQGQTLQSLQPGANLREVLIAGGVFVRSACGGNATCGQCQVRVAESGEIPYTLSERARLSGAQLADGIRLACQLNASTDLHVEMMTPVALMNWRTLREDECSRIEPAFSLRQTTVRYGVAIDLGTTQVRLALWDLLAGERIAACSGLNPQGSYGADVLTRLMEADRTEETARAMGTLIQEGIAQALHEMSSQHLVSLSEIGEVQIVGNTAMLSLLAGLNYRMLLNPENWTRRIECQPPETDFLRTAWGVNEAANIRLVTPLGGFVGSDLLAGVIATRLIRQPAGALLIDFGTNSEMALWDGQTLHVTATAGGPAFEGGGISCGMPADAGAIYRIDQAGDGIKIHVLGDSAPRGLCGSALVDATAYLLRTGQLDKVGRFTDKTCEGLVLSEGVILKRGDIDVLQRAKAAIGAGVIWLCQQAGMEPCELTQVYACGAFGRLLNVDNAQLIGLLPQTNSVRLEGNTALGGCEALLISDQAEAELADVLAVSRIYNLAEDAGFEMLFVENLYLQTIPSALKAKGRT
ncbi:MAG: ASKHA domain-containing protein [Nitrosomonadales bacterium]